MRLRDEARRIVRCLIEGTMCMCIRRLRGISIEKRTYARITQTFMFRVLWKPKKNFNVRSDISQKVNVTHSYNPFGITMRCFYISRMLKDQRWEGGMGQPETVWFSSVGWHLTVRSPIRDPIMTPQSPVPRFYRLIAPPLNLHTFWKALSIDPACFTIPYPS